MMQQERPLLEQCVKDDLSAMQNMKDLYEPDRILRFWELKGVSHDEKYKKDFINSYVDQNDFKDDY